MGGKGVTVFDSWESVGALEFLVRRARALANAGEGVEKIVEDLTALRGTTRERFPEAHLRVKDGGPVLPKHLGLGAVALSWA